MLVPEIIGLRPEKIWELLKEERYSNIYEYEGIFPLIYALAFFDPMNFHESDLSVEALVDRGLTEDFAAEVIDVYPNTHSIGLVSCVIGLLLKNNGFKSDWEPADNGFPALPSRPLSTMKAGVRGTVSHLLDPNDPYQYDEKTIWFAEDFDEMPTISPSKDHIFLYHACSWSSTCSIEAAIVPIAHYVNGAQDFGGGFYCTTDIDYALNWAKTPSNLDRIQGSPAIVVFEIHRDYASRCKTVHLEGQPWIEYVAKSRKEADYDLKIDIVEGKVCQFVQDVNNGSRIPEPGQSHQLNFKTRMAVSLLKITDVIFIKNSSQATL